MTQTYPQISICFLAETAREIYIHTHTYASTLGKDAHTAGVYTHMPKHKLTNIIAARNAEMNVECIHLHTHFRKQCV